MLHRTRFELEYDTLYKSYNGLGTTIWSPLACGLLTGKREGREKGRKTGREGERKRGEGEGRIVLKLIRKILQGQDPRRQPLSSQPR
jgi:aryl-alcohol dehydrogenase-like predicted oxidoreductase